MAEITEEQIEHVARAMASALGHRPDDGENFWHAYKDAAKMHIAAHRAMNRSYSATAKKD